MIRFSYKDEMSIVFPYKRKDFLAPSKALQDLKKKLGPVYFDAKLIECPQNAVELGKLLQKWEELDKQKFKKISEASREQRILQNSLSSRKIRDVSSVSLLSRPSSTSTFVEITHKNAPPPGFRFHANGDPKADILQTREESNQESNTTIASRTSNYDGIFSPLGNEARLSRSEDETSRHDATTKKETELEYEEIDYSKEIENLEAIILELEAQLAIRAEKEDDQTITKHNYLRAHSHADDLESCLNRPAANYAYDPDVKYKRDRYHLETAAVGPNFTSVIKKTSKCLACQFKLKHVGNEFSKPIKKKDVLKERWNIPPTGTFLSSPNLALSSSPSLASNRFGSRSSVGDKSLHELPSITGQPSKTSSRRSADYTFSLTNSRASSKDLFGRASSVSCGSSLRRFVSPTQRASKMEMLKSQAEKDCRDCQNKVDAFLGKLDRKSTSKTRVRWDNH